MAVEAIQQVTELERTVKQEKEAAAAESKQRILEAQRSARRQVCLLYTSPSPRD